MTALSDMVASLPLLSVSSDDVSEEFGVSRHVAQKHLASMYSDPKRNVSRSNPPAPYIYFIDTSTAATN